MINLVRKRFHGPGWIVLGEVANATGANARRFADAIAYGIWPSNGHVLHGFEFKISRSDLMNEIKDPSKSDGVGKYCDFWWLVVSDVKIIETVEMPSTWGVLEAKGGALRKIKDAPQREAMPMSRAFVAAMMRRSLEQGDVANVEELRKLREGQSVAIEQRVAASVDRVEKLRAELAAEKAKNERYESAARSWNKNPGEVLAYMEKVSSIDRVIGDAENRLSNLRRAAALINEAVGNSESAIKEAQQMSSLLGMLGDV